MQLSPGRTGRFGRKGVSINFVHNQKTWQDMHMIEEALGKKITRVDTNDVDVMEEVRTDPALGAHDRLLT